MRPIIHIIDRQRRHLTEEEKKNNPEKRNQGAHKRLRHQIQMELISQAIHDQYIQQQHDLAKKLPKN